MHRETLKSIKMRLQLIINEQKYFPNINMIYRIEYISNMIKVC